MTFEMAEPVLVIGLGGAGSKLAKELKEVMNSDCICISNDKKDLNGENSIEIYFLVAATTLVLYVLIF